MSGITPGLIVCVVSSHYGLDPEDVAGPSRSGRLPLARAVSMWMCRELLRYSFPMLGRTFNRDHSSCIVAVRKVIRAAELNLAFAEWLSETTFQIERLGCVRVPSRDVDVSRNRRRGPKSNWAQHYLATQGGA